MQAQYAVRGELVQRAMVHQKALQAGEARPFDKIVFCNIGNPHELGQKPITFFREVLALVDHPELLKHPRVGELFAEDAIARAKAYLSTLPGGTGAYSASQGIEVVREEVAAFMSKRDGVPANAADVFLTDGASPAVQMLIRSLIRQHSDALMIPIPQYPLYSASIALYGGSLVGYYLN
ncbi:aminotransferase class I/II-fold pyridoxal phosphate-dependent enzyme, partial [archaeon]